MKKMKFVAENGIFFLDKKVRYLKKNYTIYRNLQQNYFRRQKLKSGIAFKK